MHRLAVVWIVLLAACAGDTADPAPGVDGRLVGNWRYTRTNSLLATDLYCNLRADGSYVYTGVSITRHPEAAPRSGGGSTGRWKTEGDRLFAQPEGSNAWIEVGRFSLSGNSMVVYPPGGRPHLWER